MSKKFNVFKTPDKTSTLIQQAIKSTLDPISNNQLISGTHVPNVSITGNDIDIAFNHNLGTNQIGYHLGESDTPVSVYTSPNNNNTKYNPTPHQTTLLRFSSSQTLSISNPATTTVYFYAKNQS